MTGAVGPATTRTQGGDGAGWHGAGVGWRGHRKAMASGGARPAAMRTGFVTTGGEGAGGRRWAAARAKSCVVEMK
jgi:hypothetical protein